MATSVCNGAATIINAIATGKGAAFGIGLETKATVELDGSGEIKGKIIGSPDEDTRLIELCVGNTLKYFGAKNGATIETESEIPIARGLKSSSTAANAAVLATIGALKEGGKKIKISDTDIIKLGVKAALEAKVTITGAFDDASAAYFGGYVITDNKEMKILKHAAMEELDIIVFVPDKKSYTKDFNIEATKSIKESIEFAWGEALKGNIYEAMVTNGMLYSDALGYNPKIAKSAIDAGALAAGLSGTGPAVVAVTKGNIEKIESAWKEFGGQLIETRVNNEKAGIIRMC
ncbi:MAG: shikimate kinase [Candidatus Altiarchaeales archaeon IMC4]|nr:MAG: shikimate kinase [Candidatus Altiarchaeales archaeon IMC4]